MPDDHATVNAGIRCFRRPGYESGRSVPVRRPDLGPLAQGERDGIRCQGAVGHAPRRLYIHRSHFKPQARRKLHNLGKTEAHASPATFATRDALPWALHTVEQLKLGRPRESFDARFFPQRGGAIDNWDDGRQLDRASAARVAAGDAGTMGGQALVDVGRPAAIEAAVGAPKQVHERHARVVRERAEATCRGRVLE